MTAPEPRPGGLDGNARGLVVLVVALVVGFLLLAGAGGGGGGDDAASGGDDADATVPLDDLGTTTTEGATTTTSAPTASSRTPAEVQVIVLNGSGKNGAAASATETIGAAGFNMGTPGDGPSTETTTIYYQEGYEADATDIAALLGKSPDAIAPIAEASLGGAEGDANVVVVLGVSDTAPADSSSTSTTIAGTVTTTTVG